MLKRFWPLLTIVIIVVLAAIIIPAAATLMPKVADLGYDLNIYPTEISIGTSLINFPADVQAGEPFEVSGYLLYKAKEYTNQNGETVLRGWISPIDASLSSSYREVALPLSFKKVMVSINGTSSDQELITDGKGYFQTTVQINKKPNWPLLIHAEYLGEERITNYPGTSKLSLKTVYLSDAITIPRKENPIDGMGGITDLSSVITIALIVFALIFIIIIAYFIYRYRKKLRSWLKRRNAKVTVPEPVSTETLLVSTKTVREVSTGDPRVEILFPQTERPLPAVWGIGEPLTIRSHALIEIPENNINSTSQIEIEDHALNISTPDFRPVQLEHSFDRKGETDISVYFGVDTGDKMFNTRKIKIVDYREEIVELFNRLIDALSAKGIEVDRMMTAREIESKLIETYSDFSSDAMKDVVKGFEYANYSLHPVARKIYIDMYLAVEKIRERVKSA